MIRVLMLAISALAVFVAGSTWLALYPPVVSDLGGAPDLTRTFTPVALPVAGDRPVRAWLREGRHDQVVVLFHGFARDARRLSRYVPALGAGGASLLAVEFRSARPAGRRPTTLGAWELEDARAAIAWLRGDARFARAGVTLFGESLGASVALALAAGDPQVAGVIADCPFANGRAAFRDGVRERFGVPGTVLEPVLRAAVRGATGHDPGMLDAAAALARLGGRPVLLVQSTRGDHVSARQVSALAAAAGPGVRLWSVADAGHCEAWIVHRARYERAVRRFLDDVHAGAARRRGRAA